jgi:hypothetical protein
MQAGLTAHWSLNEAPAAVWSLNEAAEAQEAQVAAMLRDRSSASDCCLAGCADGPAESALKHAAVGTQFHGSSAQQQQQQQQQGHLTRTGSDSGIAGR